VKLLLDIGNTRIKWAWLAGGQLQDPGSLVHRGREPPDALSFLDSLDIVPDEVRAANVAGADMARLVGAAISARFGLEVRFAATPAGTGTVRNGYTDPRQLGVDRWLAIVAAFQRYQQPVCIVDAGTAVTVDLVDGEGQHLGGVIIPGLDLMEQALHRDTGDIRIHAGSPAGVPGRAGLVLAGDTASAVHMGAYRAVTGLVRQCLDELQGRCGAGRLVMTGGDSERLRPMLDLPVEERPLLVLEGLAGGELS